MKEKKRVKSVVMGTPTIRALLIMASSLQEVSDLLLRTSETFDSQTWSNLTADSQLKSMGIMWGTSILLPFICELGLTSLYLLDNQRIKMIPKEHSLLYWWNRLKKDTKDKITQQFEEVKNKESEIKEDLEEILKWNDKSHTEWRYWWRKGFAVGSPSSIAMEHLTKIIIDLAWSYPKDQRNRILQNKVDGFKNYHRAKKKRNID